MIVVRTGSASVIFADGELVLRGCDGRRRCAERPPGGVACEHDEVSESILFRRRPVLLWGLFGLTVGVLRDVADTRGSGHSSRRSSAGDDGSAVER